ncbi:energy-coupling factor transporter transmembrane component T [Sedimentibacter sp.]|uniref:energy-coupling factor transporter transmembrane component T n=1 Tax=Sedimentibacter sp. TaxID=1960295 RepID=UPI00289E4C08|nr:energy-coupling factor transporter transmembrane component T [Sedimentibacter sp.]
MFIIVSVTSFMAKDIMYGSCVFAVVCILVCLLGQGITAAKNIVLYIIIIALMGLAPFMPAVLRSIVLMTALCIRMFMPVVLYARAFTKATPISDVITGMYSLKLPRSLVITFAVAMRFFPTAKEELRNINDAMRLRGMGFSFSNFVRHPVYLFEGFCTPMMMRAATISEELSASAITRGLDNPQPRSAFRKLRITFSDIAITVLFSIALCAVIVVKRYMGGAV